MGAMANLVRHLHGLRVQHLQARQALPLCFTQRYCSAHDSDSVPSADVEAVRDALLMALEGASYVGQSTEQAYLETDPADRSSGKGAIQLRYQAMAYQELQRALAQFSAAEQRLGRAELLGASKGLAVTLADSLLARDKLEAALRRGEAAERDKRLVGLRRENLTFCGDG